MYAPAPPILDVLVTAAREQTARRRAAIPGKDLAERARSVPASRDLLTALTAPGLSVIAEMKQRSPSAEVLTDGYRPRERAAAYERGGAAAISVLTHEAGFGGTLDDLARVRSATELPLLRKDFVVDEGQVVEARAMSADAVLLIVAVLTSDRLGALLECVHDHHMEALVEVRDAAELDVALSCGAPIVGVNHRDLRTFILDMSLTRRLRRHIGDKVVMVAESGVGSAAEAGELRHAGADAVLVGELLMQAEDPERAVRELSRA